MLPAVPGVEDAPPFRRDIVPDRDDILKMVAAVDRCLALIETLAQEAEGLSLGDIAARLDMPKSATHRMLATLAAHGYVTQDPATQAYLLSLRLAVLAFRYLDARRLPDVAQTVLDRLARDTAEYCRLAVVEGD